jgi:predicted phosphate transport protein (TIGR00153 family)
VRFRLVPRDEGFFVMFDQAAQNAASLALLVQEALTRLPDVELLAEKTIELERRGDAISREIIGALDRSIVTPFDREDIHALTESIDNAVDHMNAAVDLIRLHGIREPIDIAPGFGNLLVQASEATVRLVAKLARLRDTDVEIDMIDQLESEGDQLFRQTTALLFSGSFDAFTVLRWKDVNESLEAALNSFERTADVVRSIVLKHT